MNIADLIKTIDSAAENPSLFDNASEEEKAALMRGCEKLRGRVESGMQMTWRIIFSPYEAVALRLGVDMKLFDAAFSKGGEDITVQELAAFSGAEELLVTRVMRLLTGMDLFSEVGGNTFRPSLKGKIYCTASPFADAVVHLTTQLEVILHLPAYFSAHGYISPTDAFDSPFQAFRQTPQHAFAWLASQPALQKAANTVMALARTSSSRGAQWFDFFPVLEKLTLPKNKADAPLIVDVGGGLGQALIALNEKFPTLGGDNGEGKMVVQDLDFVIADIKENSLPSSIKAVAHDFFTPQPPSCRGAKAYYLRAVLHDWPAKQALQILGHIKAAMDEESVVLINEEILREVGEEGGEAGEKRKLEGVMDFTMMGNFSSLERTEKIWRELLEEAGLEVVGVWRAERGVKSSGGLFEARLKR